jgi:hypothetical protein
MGSDRKRSSSSERSSSRTRSKSPKKITEKVCEEVRKEYVKVLGGTLQDNVVEIGDVKEGVCTYSIDLEMPDLIINGYESKSPLANYALGSTEVAFNPKRNKCDYLNLFEIMIPDTPNYISNLSRGQAYVKFLDKEGLNSSVAHFHWWGMTPFMAAIHTQNIGMCPVKFAKKIAKALKHVGMKHHKKVVPK